MDSRHWLMVSAAAVVVAAVVNAMLGPPIVFADEFTYYAAAVGLKAGAGVYDLPNRLFLSIYGLAAASLSPFSLARTLNSIALVLGLASLYAASRSTNARGWGLAVAAAYGFGTLATYTAYFMPDVLFGAVYLATCTAFAIALAMPNAIAGAVAATGCAALTFIKPHGWVTVAVLAAVALIHLLSSQRTKDRRVQRAIAIAFGAFTLSWAAGHVLLPDVHTRAELLGQMYGGQARRLVSAISDSSRYRAFATLFAVEILTLASLCAPALLYAAWEAIRRRTSDESAPDRVARLLAVVSLGILLALTALTAVFTITTEGAGPNEVANRLHWRLYSYAIPLLIIGMATSSSAEAFFRKNLPAVVVAWGAASIVSFFVLPHYVWSFVDSPDMFFGWSAPKYTFVVFGAIGAASCGIFGRYRGGVAAASVLVFVSNALASGISVRQVQLSVAELPENRAGRFASALAEERRKPLVLLGDNKTVELYRVASYLPLAARFATSAEVANDAAGNALRGAVVVGNGQDIRRLGISPIAEFGPWIVGVFPDRHAPDRQTRLGPTSHSLGMQLSFSKSALEPGIVERMLPGEDWRAWSAQPRITGNLPRE